MVRRLLCLLALVLLSTLVLAPAASAHQTVLVGASGVFAGDDTTAAGKDGDEATMSTQALPILTGGGTREVGGGRPAVTAEPTGAADRVTAPAALINSAMVVASVRVGDQTAPLVVPQAKLPFAYFVERQLANRLGLAESVASMRQWDGVPGSRWATRHAGVIEERVAEQKVDGRSVLFAMDACPAGVGGYAYWQLSGGVADARYGSAGMYVDEVDIGICPVVTTTAALNFVVQHEVGHALGLQHLCDRGQECWRAEMGSGSHACRVMYAGASNCREMARPEHDSAIHLYPKLQRVAGPSRVETAARYSFASFGANSAPTVVLARADAGAHGPLAGAALSGALGASFLLGNADAQHCVTGAAAEELARVAARPARVVLVGAWPVICDQLLTGWELTVDRVDGATPEALGVAVADRLAGAGRLGDKAFLVTARADASGHVPDGVAAGAAAGANRAPVLYTAGDRLGEDTAAWLRAHPAVRRVYVMGGAAALSEAVLGQVRALGVDVVRVSGPTRVHTATALASRTELFAAGKPVVIAAAGGWADAVTGSALGGRMGAPVLVTAPGGDAPVTQWLQVRRPAGGFVVGGTKALPYTLQYELSRLLR